MTDGGVLVFPHLKTKSPTPDKVRLKECSISPSKANVAALPAQPKAQSLIIKSNPATSRFSSTPWIQQNFNRTPPRRRVYAKELKVAYLVATCSMHNYTVQQKCIVWAQWFGEGREAKPWFKRRATESSWTVREFGRNGVFPSALNKKRVFDLSLERSRPAAWGSGDVRTGWLSLINWNKMKNTSFTPAQSVWIEDFFPLLCRTDIWCFLQILQERK